MRIVQEFTTTHTGADWATVVIVESRGHLLGLSLGKVTGVYLTAIRHLRDHRQVFASRPHDYPVAALNELFEALLAIEEIDDLAPFAAALLPERGRDA